MTNSGNSFGSLEDKRIKNEVLKYSFWWFQNTVFNSCRSEITLIIRSIHKKPN